MKTEISQRLIDKALVDVSEILKSVFGEDVKVEIKVHDVEAEKMLQAYGFDGAKAMTVLSHKEHSMAIYTKDYLPFESKRNSFKFQGIIE